MGCTLPELHFCLRDLVLCGCHMAGCINTHATLLFSPLGGLPCWPMCCGHGGLVFFYKKLHKLMFSGFKRLSLCRSARYYQSRWIYIPCKYQRKEAGFLPPKTWSSGAGTPRCRLGFQSRAFKARLWPKAFWALQFLISFCKRTVPNRTAARCKSSFSNAQIL